MVPVPDAGRLVRAARRPEADRTCGRSRADLSLRCLDGLTVVRKLDGPAAGSSRGVVAERSGISSRCRPSHLAVFPGLEPTGDALDRSRQRRRRVGIRRVSDFADQRRVAARGHARGARFRLPHAPGTGAELRACPGHTRVARTVPWALLQLVRYSRPPTTASTVCLVGGQRQSLRIVADDEPGVPGRSETADREPRSPGWSARPLCPPARGSPENDARAVAISGDRADPGRRFQFGRPEGVVAGARRDTTACDRVDRTSGSRRRRVVTAAARTGRGAILGGCVRGSDRCRPGRVAQVRAVHRDPAFTL